MTIQEIRAKIVEWITTGIPSNVKSFRIRTLLTNMAIRMDLLEAGRLKITKAEGNFALELEVGDNIYGYIESQLVYDAIYLGGDISLLSSYLVLNGPGSGGASSGYFEYDDIADMIANQLEQTTGDRCYVADASDDPNVTSGDAIYIYLGTTLEDLIDYRRLTDGEISLVTNNINRTFRVTDLSTSASTTVDSGLVKVQYENVDNSVIAILFPIDFSKYLLGMQSNDSEYDFAISIFNRTQNCWVGEASVGFVTVNTNYVKVTTSQKLIPYPNLAAGDIIEVYFDSYKTSAGIITLTGDGVDNTDPLNLVLTFPTAAEVGAYSTSQVDALIAIKQVIKTGNFTLAPADNDNTISMDGGICTINPNTQTYVDKTVVAMKNITDSTDGSIVCTAATGWTYKVNDNATVASGTFTFPAGATCTIIKFEGTNKIYIDGGVE